MGAFVFHLTAKILLAREGQYDLSETDGDQCRSVDRLLTKVEWEEGSEDGVSSMWQTTLAEAYTEGMFREAEEEAIALLEKLDVNDPAPE